MSARTSCSVLSVKRALVVAPGSPWDILFLLSEVASGASAGHFSQNLENLKSQKPLALQCIKAILSRFWLLRRFARANHFVAARLAAGTVGAALAHADRDDDRRRVITLQYLVVDPRFRRRGIGLALVQHLMTNAPAGTVVQCACTPKSQDMQRLLRRLGFMRTQRASLVRSPDARVLMPALWEWHP
jgi:ribosomal protein S18 acetylase RimI-like enzyme